MHCLTRRLAAVLFVFAATVAAQTTAADWNTVKTLVAGTDVRIASGSRTASGKLGRVTDETIVVNSGKGSEMFTQQEVTRVSVGKQGHRARNALIGLGAGAGVGLVVGLAARSGSGGFGPNLDNLVTTVLAVGGAVGGIIVGAVIPTGGWREIYKK